MDVTSSSTVRSITLARRPASPLEVVDDRVPANRAFARSLPPSPRHRFITAPLVAAVLAAADGNSGRDDLQTFRNVRAATSEEAVQLRRSPRFAQASSPFAPSSAPVR